MSFPRIPFFTLAFLFLVSLMNCQRTEKGSILDDLRPALEIGALGFIATSPFDQYAEKNINLARFTGTWKEMQRINTGFQAGLSDVTATYTARPDGSIGVRNEGTNTSGSRTGLDGVALVPSPERGILKVSFAFPFFFGDFIILRIDRENYQTALIGGPTPNFLWVFSRTDTIESSIEKDYINYAQSIGYSTTSLQRFRSNQ